MRCAFCHIGGAIAEFGNAWRLDVGVCLLGGRPLGGVGGAFTELCVRCCCSGEECIASPLLHNQFPAMDVWVWTSMKGAAKCDKQCELQDSENHQTLECILHLRALLEGMLFSALVDACVGHWSEVLHGLRWHMCVRQHLRLLPQTCVICHATEGTNEQSSWCNLDGGTWILCAILIVMGA